jgi:hypothetical protein
LSHFCFEGISQCCTRFNGQVQLPSQYESEYAADINRNSNMSSNYTGLTLLGAELPVDALPTPCKLLYSEELELHEFQYPNGRFSFAPHASNVPKDRLPQTYELGF